jgi:hypothetical protein
MKLQNGKFTDVRPPKQERNSQTLATPDMQPLGVLHTSRNAVKGQVPSRQTPTTLKWRNKDDKQNGYALSLRCEMRSDEMRNARL